MCATTPFHVKNLAIGAIIVLGAFMLGIASSGSPNPGPSGPVSAFAAAAIEQN